MKKHIDKPNNQEQGMLQLILRSSKPQWKNLRRLRCTEIEIVYGQIKWNYSFNRFHIQGLKKISLDLEWELVCFAHNFRYLNNLCVVHKK